MFHLFWKYFVHKLFLKKQTNNVLIQLLQLCDVIRNFYCLLALKPFYSINKASGFNFSDRYENTPVQIYWKFYNQKVKHFW